LKTDSGHRKDAGIEFVQVSSRVAFGMKTVTAAGIPLLVFFPCDGLLTVTGAATHSRDCHSESVTVFEGLNPPGRARSLWGIVTLSATGRLSRGPYPRIKFGGPLLSLIKVHVCDLPRILAGSAKSLPC